MIYKTREEVEWKDNIGHIIHDGDIVLNVPRLEVFAEKGTVLKISPKTCEISREENRFGTDSHARRYNEIISLTALKQEDVEIEHDQWNWDFRKEAYGFYFEFIRTNVQLNVQLSTVLSDQEQIIVNLIANNERISKVEMAD